MIKNRCKIVFKGLNQERVVSDICKKIKIYNYKKGADHISTLEVDYRNQKLLKKMLKDNRLEIVESSARGIKQFFKRILTSYGIIAGIALGVLSFAFQSSFVLKIEVFGQERGQNGQVEHYIENSLATRLKWKIDTKNIESEILREFEDVSSASVAIIGQTLIVNLNELQLPQEMEEEFSPLVSQYDGRIANITLIQGTPAIEKGDIVKKGDVLVYPYVIDSEGEKRPTQPKAEIMAEVWLETTETYYDVCLKRERTGRKIVYNNIYLNDLLVFSGEKSNPFAEYEISRSWQDISCKNLLPLKKEKVVVFETCTKEVRLDFSQEKDDIVENARKKTLLFLQENDIIIEEVYNIKEESGWHEVTFVLSVMRNIGG